MDIAATGSPATPHSAAPHSDAGQADAGQADAGQADAGALARQRAMRDATRDAGEQYALPLVVRVERASPPERTDALECAARAVLTLLSDPRSAGDGEWAAEI